jgi:hypothetical protein
MDRFDPSCRPLGICRDRAVSILAVLLVFWVVVWLLPRVSWYLAIDQFGYLTFARDLGSGRVSHSWALLPLLDSFLPAGRQVDVLAQTYFWRDGGLYSRYAPGFPLLLAFGARWTGWDCVFSYPPFFLGLFLLLFYSLGRALLRSGWLGFSSIALLVLLPTQFLLWSVSPLRDVPAHIFGVAALLTLLPSPREAVVGTVGSQPSPLGMRRAVLGGLLFGYAVCVRPDAILYGLPLTAAIALAWRVSRRSSLALLAGTVLGLLPMLAYNTIAQGNPLRPSQGMELEALLALSPPGDSGSAPAGDAGAESVYRETASKRDAPRAGSTGRESSHGLASAVGWIFGGSSAFAAMEGGARRPHEYLQGGGLRISNLSRTLPGNLALYARVFGLSGCLLGLWGVFVARRFPLFFWVVVPYVVVATVFFGMWPESDPRYLAGAFAFFSLLVLAGGRDLAGSGARAGWAGLALLLVVGWVSGQLPFAQSSTRAWTLAALLASIATALLLRTARPLAKPGVVFPAVLVLSLSVLAAIRLTATADTRASFGQAEVSRAVETLESAAGPRSVVFTSADLGRPAENINYYTGLTSLYLADLARWNVAPAWVIDQVLKEGFEVYLLLPESAATQWMTSRFIYPWFSSSIEAEIPPGEAERWFVATRGSAPPNVWWVRVEKRPQALAPPGGAADPPQF